MVQLFFNQGCCVVKNSDYFQVKLPETRPTKKNIVLEKSNNKYFIERQRGIVIDEYSNYVESNNNQVQVVVNDEQKGDILYIPNNPSQVHKSLRFTIKDSLTLPLDTVITITPYTINNIPYKIGTPLVFGKDDKENHYNFPEEERIGNKQFDIIYDEVKNLYTIKDDNIYGTGLFYKIDRFIKLEVFMILSFCRTHIFINILENNILELRFLQGDYKNTVLNLNPRQKKIIRLGRNKRNDIVYKEENVSRNQCTFVFEDEWFIYDGCLNAPSTNGLWVLASKRVEILDNMVFKSGYTTFVANLI